MPNPDDISLDTVASETAAIPAVEADAQATSAPETNTQATTDDSPSSEVSDRDGLLKVVQDAVKPKDETDDGTSAETKGETDPETGKPTSSPDAATDNAGSAEEDLPDPTEDELAQLKPKARKRVSQLLRQRAELRGELDAVKPDVEAARQLKGYLERHQLSPDDANTLLGVGAALRRGDFQAFLDGVMPYVDVARQSLGVTYAPDLREKVEDGSMSEEAARELTRTRLDAHRAKAEVQTQRQQTDNAQTQAAAAAVTQAVSEWEKTARSRDPDYARKEILIQRAARGLMAEQGPPRSPADAVQLVQRAYDEVNNVVKASAPAPRATRPTPAGVSTPSLGAAPQPRSMLEAVRLAARRVATAGA